MPLIITLPPVHQEDLLKLMIEYPAVGAVRYNTGGGSNYDPYQTLEKILALAKPLNKAVWVDLKAKQLRAIEPTFVPDNPIKLNHKLSVDLPANVYLRGAEGYKLCEVRGNEVIIDCPRQWVGKGQSINVLGKNLKIEGGLLDLDHQYIKAALDLDIHNFMLSFVEHRKDVSELEDAIVRHSRGTKTAEDCKIVFKIESESGVEFVRGLQKKHFAGRSPYRIMAARDDLQVHIGLLNMPDAVKLMAQRDPQAICASRLLMGLEEGAVTNADLSDIELMRSYGYQHFMLSDGISRDHTEKALEFWQKYSELNPFEKRSKT